MSLSAAQSYLSKIGIVLLAIFAPIKAVMLTVGFLIIADLLTGIWASLKRGEKLSSAAMRRTISKMLIYQLCIISAFFIESNIMQDVLPICKIVAGVIALVELKSLLENSNTILGMDIFAELIKKLGSRNDPRL